jgi:hypothetical protein
MWLDVTNRTMVEFAGGWTAPVPISPGHADESVTVFLGYGRRRAGRVGTGIGYNAAVGRRTRGSNWRSNRKTGERYALACTKPPQHGRPRPGARRHD